MGKTTTNTEENTTKINIWPVTDSDGSIVELHSDPNITIPSDEFLQELRAHSLANPDTAIMVLSGRKDNDLTRFYEKAFEPNEEGITPNIVLASENGAFLRLSTDSENLHKLAEPLSDELKKRIKNMVKEAVGECYCEKFPDSIDDKIRVRVEMKTFGLSVHYRIPSEKADQGNEVLDKIKNVFEVLATENPKFHKDYNAANAFTLELVSKGVTMEKLANHDPSLVAIFKRSGLSTSKPSFVAYTGDDRGDWPALNVLNEMLNKGLCEGYTLRTCNYSPTTPDANIRTPNGPKETGTRDSFYVLGSKEVSAQEQHRNGFVNKAVHDKLSKLRKELLNKGLLPSQSGDDQTPPIVLLTTGDILIQEPERYKPEVLDKLKDWNLGKVILMANESNSNSSKVKQLALANENLVAVSPQGQVFTHQQNQDCQINFEFSKRANEIVSANPERSAEIQLLRVVQEVLVTIRIIKKNEQAQEALAGIASIGNREAIPQESVADAPSVDLASLAAGPSSVVTTTSSRKRRNSSNSNKGKIQENRRRGSWTNKKKKNKKSPC